MVQGGGFEPPKLSRQIYSLIPLATREPLPKSRSFSAADPTLSTTSLFQGAKFGAGERNRTPNLLITSQLLCQLSYASTPDSQSFSANADAGFYWKSPEEATAWQGFSKTSACAAISVKSSQNCCDSLALHSSAKTSQCSTTSRVAACTSG